MKSLYRLAFTVISAGVVLLAGGCSEKTGGGDLIWDIAPFSVTFRVINAQGEDLLNPETPENILENGITATYDGKVYELNADKVDYYPDTKAIIPVFQGLHTVYIQGSDTYNLCFGEFSRDQDWKRTDVIINWGNGTSDTVSFTNTVSWKSNKPSIKTTFYMNDREYGVNETIVKIL